MFDSLSKLWYSRLFRFERLKWRPPWELIISIYKHPNKVLQSHVPGTCCLLSCFPVDLQCVCCVRGEVTFSKAIHACPSKGKDKKKSFSHMMWPSNKADSFFDPKTDATTCQMHPAHGKIQRPLPSGYLDNCAHHGRRQSCSRDNIFLSRLRLRRRICFSAILV